MKNFIVFIFCLAPSVAVLLDCDFVFYDWRHSGTRYTCNVKNLEVSEPNLRFLSMSGQHLFNKSNSDVTGLVFEHQAMNHLTHGGNAFFSKLEDLAVLNSGLSYVQRSNFRQVKNIKTLALCSNRLHRLPEDVFIDLTKLQYLNLSSNQLKSLPSFVFRPLINLKGLYLNENSLQEISHLLFKHNMKLEEIFMNDNEIKFISTNVTDSLRELKHFYLLNNVCISKNYNDITPIFLNQFKRDVSESCSSECEHEISEVAECNEKIYELERICDDLKREVDRLRGYLKANTIL